MPSPFPGMNPYLEGPEIWEDFHAALAAEIRAQLAIQLRPKYVAILTPKVTYDQVGIQTAPPEQPQLIKPDVALYRRNTYQPHGGVAVMIPPAPLIGVAMVEVPVKTQRIEIREVGTHALVTVIELLSPVNKRPSHHAFKEYQRKRRDLMRTDVHLLELDLLRGGTRSPLMTELPKFPYFVFLSRAFKRAHLEIWPLHYKDEFPLLPVPLLEPDPDVPLDLGQAIHTVYDDAAYDLRIDYRQPVPKPALDEAEAVWVRDYLVSVGLA